MEEVAYLFIDGGYLNKAHQDNLCSIFGQHVIDYGMVKDFAQARKAFYYDSLDKRSYDKLSTKERASETEVIFDTRKAQQEENTSIR